MYLLFLFFFQVVIPILAPLNFLKGGKRRRRGGEGAGGGGEKIACHNFVW